MKKYIIYLLLTFMTIINVNASEPITYNISSNHIKMTIIVDNVVLAITPEDTFDNNADFYILNINTIDNALKIFDDLYTELSGFTMGRILNYKINDNVINLLMLYNEYDDECYYIKNNNYVYTLSKSDLKRLQKKLIKHYNKFNKN